VIKFHLNEVIAVFTKASTQTGFLLAVLVLPMTTHAATESIDTYQSQRQAVKQEQASVAEAAGVSLMHVSKGTAYTTRMKGVPEELSSMVVYDEKSLAPLVKSLSPYYGFDGNQELRFVDKTTNEIDTVYIVRQYIHGIETTADLHLRVDNKTARLIRVDGWLYGGVGIESRSRVSKTAAIELVVEQVEKPHVLMASRNGLTSAPQKLKVKGVYEAVPLYRPFGEEQQPAIWWGIGVEVEPSEKQSDSEQLYEWFYVDPEGAVSPWVEGNSRAVGLTMVCNGAGTSVIFCHSGGTTIINTAGQCLDNALCGSASSPYRLAHDTAADVGAMWNDLYPGHNLIGANNQNYGGDLEIKINGSALGSNSGVYTALRIGPNHIRRAGMIIDGGTLKLDEVVAHEMGHGWHALKDFTSWATPTPSLTVKAQYEHNAVTEYIGDVNSIIFKNYNGPGSSPRFNQTPSFNTASGQNYAQQYNYSSLLGAYSDYQNARVGGHAFYELIQSSAVNFILASKLFFGAVDRMQDDDGNGFISFAEVRNSMMRYANQINTSNAVKSAIQDAWGDTGVGDASGISPDTGTATGPSGGGTSVPGPVTNFSFAYTIPCSNGWTHFDINYTSVPGATYYEYWYKGALDSNYKLRFSSNKNPAKAKVSAFGVDVKMKACNGVGCSSLSSLWRNASYFCW